MFGRVEPSRNQAEPSLEPSTFDNPSNGKCMFGRVEPSRNQAEPSPEPSTFDNPSYGKGMFGFLTRSSYYNTK